MDGSATDPVTLMQRAEGLFTNNCSIPHLPSELWGQIFTYLDEFTLWMVVRHVSKLLRAEIEGEMTRKRLPKLHFNWEFSGGYVTYKEKDYDYHGTYNAVRLAKFSEDDERVYFDTSGGFWLYDDMAPGDQARFDWDDGPPVVLLEGDLSTRIQEGLTHSDLAYRRPNAPRHICLGASVNEIEVPGLDIELASRRLSFQWKHFLTDFFVEEAYVRNKRKVLGLSYQESPTMTDLQEFQALQKQDPPLHGVAFTRWNRSHTIVRSKNDELLEEAYEKRLEKSHARAGLSICLDKKPNDGYYGNLSHYGAITSHVFELEYHRRKQLSFALKH